MNVLGIESSCDETACAIVRDGREILSNIIYSQDDLHGHWGGVIPELACRRHVETLLPVVEQALAEAGLTLDQIDAIAAAKGPGLVGALMIGLNGAKALALATGKPLIGINHIEAHLFAPLIGRKSLPEFPCLGAVFSGGHTSLVKMEGVGKYQLLSQTTDDAIGEAFDKVAKILGLPYPGGPHVERLARNGNPLRYPFKAGRVKQRPLYFSFSGLKTAVLYASRGQNATLENDAKLSEQEIADLCASFQHTAFEDVVDKTLKAAGICGCQTIIFGGGVTNNRRLREIFSKAAPGFDLIWPSGRLSLDNGAMIAALGYHKLAGGARDSLEVEVECGLGF